MEPVAAVVVIGLAVLAVAVAIIWGRSSRDPDSDGTGSRVLVAMADPATAPALGALALSVAVRDQGKISAIHVVTSDDIDAARERIATLTQGSQALAAEYGLDFSGGWRVDASIADGILHLVLQHDATLLIVGWPEPGTDLDTATIGPVLTASPVPVLVTRVRSFEWDQVRLHIPDESELDAAAATAETEGAHGGLPDGLAASLRLAIRTAERLASSRGVIVDRVSGPLAATSGSGVLIVPVEPTRTAVEAAIARAPDDLDLVFAMAHGTDVRERGPLLAASERLYVEAVGAVAQS